MKEEKLIWDELKNRDDVLHIMAEEAQFVNHHKLENTWMLIGKKDKTALKAVEVINPDVLFRALNVMSLESTNYVLADFFFLGVKKIYKIRVEEDYNNIFLKLLETSKIKRKYLA